MQKDPLIEIIKSEFEKKCERNKQYSLRSFSRDLEMDVSNLSKILSYQKPVGKNLREKLAKKLGFTEEEIEKLSTGKFANTLDSSYESHDLEIFQIVSQWQHYAILELFKIKNFNATPEEIQKSLGVTEKVATESLARLEEVGLIKLNKKTKRLEPVDESSSSILNQATSKAHRNQQKEILEGAIDALAEIPIEWRSQSSMTMAIDVEKLPEARDMIKDFRRNLGRLLSSSKNLNEVYQLSVSLYPLTNNYNRENDQ